MIQFNESVCRNLDLASRREWLETNGIGGFASSTITGLNTRRYHGLLVAATRPPLGRMVLLSKLEETLVLDGERFDLSCNRFGGAMHPHGYLFLKGFRLDPYPIATYAVGGLEMEKSVFMVYGENTTVVQYRLRGRGPASCILELRPLIAVRDFHSTTHENGALNATIDQGPESVTCSPYAGCPSVWLGHGGAEVEKTGYWYRSFEYTAERERGLDFNEDLFNPLTLTFDLNVEREPAVVASDCPRERRDPEQLRAAELDRRSRVACAARSCDTFVTALEQAADRFLVRRGEHSTVIAGYHWFSDWGRDTMIALPGLTLATGRPDVARGILLAFAKSVDRGMLPNRFTDAGEAPEYNAVDATLWFFEAIRAYGVHSGDYEFIRINLYGVLAGIADWHERGTRYGIRVDNDGLLQAGEPGVQLTWMDSKVGERVVTQRSGKPVEIEALWYNALCVMQDLASRFGDPTRTGHYASLAAQARVSFNEKFWNAPAECLYDVIGDDGPDPSIRPNQIFAVSLFHTMLGGAKAAAVVATVERELLTPYGLRTLSPSDPQYRGRFEGDGASRDSAYHQGTVWPWLLGPFITAYLRVHDDGQEQASRWLGELRRFIADEGVGQIPEVFDGDAPYRAGGCIAQAWSVAELLRVSAEADEAALRSRGQSRIRSKA